MALNLIDRVEKRWFWWSFVGATIPLVLFVSWHRNTYTIPLHLIFLFLNLAAAHAVRLLSRNWSNIHLGLSAIFIVAVTWQAFTVGIFKGPTLASHVWFVSGSLLLLSTGSAILAVLGRSAFRSRHGRKQPQPSKQPPHDATATEELIIPLNYRRLSLYSLVCGLALVASLTGVLMQPSSPLVVLWGPLIFFAGYFFAYFALIVGNDHMLLLRAAAMCFFTPDSDVVIPWRNVVDISLRTSFGSKKILLRLDHIEEFDIITKSPPPKVLFGLSRVLRCMTLIIMNVPGISLIQKVFKGSLELSFIGRSVDLDIDRERAYLKSVWQSSYERCGFHIAVMDIYALSALDLAREAVKRQRLLAGQTNADSVQASALNRETMSDIFISYKREDQPAARRLADAIEKEGWNVWWDPKLRAGEHFDDVIEAALKNSKCVIVLWSTQSLQSRYVRDEATYALERNKLVPVAIENVELPFRFRGVHTLRLSNWDGSKDSSEFRKLVDDITAIIGKPAHWTAPGDSGPSGRG